MNLTNLLLNYAIVSFLISLILQSTLCSGNDTYYWISRELNSVIISDSVWET